MQVARLQKLIITTASLLRTNLWQHIDKYGRLPPEQKAYLLRTVAGASPESVGHLRLAVLGLLLNPANADFRFKLSQRDEGYQRKLRRQEKIRSTTILVS